MPDVAPQNPASSTQYFPEAMGTPQGNKFISFLKKVWQTFQYYARQVWPWMYRLINFIVYESLKVIKGIIKIGLQQVGMFKE